MKIKKQIKYIFGTAVFLAIAAVLQNIAYRAGKLAEIRLYIRA